MVRQAATHELNFFKLFNYKIKAIVVYHYNKPSFFLINSFNSSTTLQNSLTFNNNFFHHLIIWKNNLYFLVKTWYGLYIIIKIKSIWILILIVVELATNHSSNLGLFLVVHIRRITRTQAIDIKITISVSWCIPSYVRPFEPLKGT